MKIKTDVSRSYLAKSVKEQQTAYDNWASQYEVDICGMGYRIPAVIAAAFIRFVPPDTSPILDAGCGGGIQAEPLSMMGYHNIVGIDLSDGMLEVARSKNIYSELKQATLGEALEFPDNYFGAVVSSGTITPKHAPPHSFEELVRVTKTGAPIVFSMRDDPLQEPEYPAIVSKLEHEGKWEPVFTGASFHSMPYGEPDISHWIHVYAVR